MTTLLKIEREFFNTRFNHGGRVVISMELVEYVTSLGKPVKQYFSDYAFFGGDDDESHTFGSLTPMNEILQTLWPMAELAVSLSHCNENGVPVNCLTKFKSLYLLGSFERLSKLLRITFAEAIFVCKSLDAFNDGELEIEIALVVNSYRHWWKCEAAMVKTFLQTNGETYTRNQLQ